MYPYAARLVFAFTLNLLVAGTVHATQATATIDEVFSNFDGSVQFIMMGTLGNPAPSLADRTLVATDGSSARRYTFATDAPANPLSHHILVATQGFADLALIQPDYVVPNGFLYLSNGSLALDDAVFAYYGAQLPTDGVHALYRDPFSGIGQAYVATVGNARGDIYSFLRNPKLGGLWWNNAEPGWGFAVDQQANVLFAAWATYDFDGSPVWFFMPRGNLLPLEPDEGNSDIGSSGSIYMTTGPAFAAGRFDSSLVAAIEVGTGTFRFLPGDTGGTGTFDFRINNVTGRKDFTQAVFGDPVPECFDGVALGPIRNYQGLWSNPSEPGWGIHLSHQGNVIFAVWFTYDATGKATWLSVTAQGVAPDSFSGTVYRTTGPTYGAAPDPSAVKSTAVGTATLAFADRSHGTFAYAVNGISQTKDISREVFANPPTVCE